MVVVRLGLPALLACALGAASALADSPPSLKPSGSTLVKGRFIIELDPSSSHLTKRDATPESVSPLPEAPSAL